jgi:hypothetical protein
MSLAQICDYYDDVNKQVLYKLSKLVELPEFVKSASVETREELQGVPAHAYADAVRNKFPTHTKEATLLSQLYFLNAKHLYDSKEAGLVQVRIDAGAKYWSILGATHHVKKAWHDAHNPVAPDLADDDYALVTEYEGQTIRRFPMPTPASTKEAAHYLYQNRAKYPLDWRRTAARKILTKVAEHNAEVDPIVHEYLCKAAGFGSNSPERVYRAMARRVYAATDKYRDLQVKLAEVANSVRALKSPPSPKFMSKIAMMIDQFDRTTGLHRLYDEGSMDLPEEICFELTEKVATAVKNDHIVLTTGTALPISYFTEMPLDKLAGIMGTEFSQAVASEDGIGVDPIKFAQIVPTLPLDDARLLEQAMASAGNEKQARAPLMANAEFSKEEMVEMLRKQGLKPSTRDFSLTVPMNPQNG